MTERFLITGALGCIGAWASAQLVRENVPVVVYDLGENTGRLELVLSPEELDRLTLIRGDVTDLDQLEQTIVDHGITHVVHLAAMLLPLVKADPPRGAAVNVVGTTNVFEAAKRHGVRGIAYASSAAVYGPGAGPRVEDAGEPTSLYGVFKLANEGNARVYWLEDGLASVGLRPMTVYGVGRDQGMTSGPTKAIVAAVLGRPYTVGFGGPTLFQYAEDAARMLVAASRSEGAEANVYNMPGTMADGRELVDAIEAAVPASRGLVDFEPVSLPFPTAIDHDGIEAIGPVALTPFADGVRESVAIYEDLAAAGRLDGAAHGLEVASRT